MREFESIELFSGAGGLALGLHKAGFRHRALVERDTNACDTIRLNQQNPKNPFFGTELIESDVRKIDFRDFGEGIDLVAGGPPCQPFSLGGRHKGYNDQRDMFPQAIRAVRELKPRGFIFENVKGLLRPSFSTYLAYITLQLSFPELVKKEDEDWLDHYQNLQKHRLTNHAKDLAYHVTYKLLNSASYGVPQVRQRVFIVGFRKDLGIQWKPPIETHSEEALNYSKWSTFEYWDRHKIPFESFSKYSSGSGVLDGAIVSSQLFNPFSTKPWMTVRDAISNLPQPSTEDPPEFPNHIFKGGAKSYPGHTGSPLDLPAKTLKAGVHGVPGGENMLRRPDGTIRYFTAREAARIQTFPDDHIFEGAWSKIMRQLGNAVPVNLAAVVGKSVIDQINGEPKNARGELKTVQSTG